MFVLKNMGILSGHRSYKDLRVLSFISGKIIAQFLEKAQLSDWKPASSHMKSGNVLSKTNGLLLDDATMYSSIIGALQYYTLTKPNISYDVNNLCQFMHFLTTIHWIVANRLLTYLHGTKDLGILLLKIDFLTLTKYCEAASASYPNDRRSTGGLCEYLGNSRVSWSSGKYI